MTTESTTSTKPQGESHTIPFARAWMQRKREEQACMVEEFKTDPDIIAAYAELKRQNEVRGTRIIEYSNLPT